MDRPDGPARMVGSLCLFLGVWLQAPVARSGEEAGAAPPAVLSQEVVEILEKVDDRRYSPWDEIDEISYVFHAPRALTLPGGKIRYTWTKSEGSRLDRF